MSGLPQMLADNESIGSVQKSTITPKILVRSA